MSNDPSYENQSDYTISTDINGVSSITVDNPNQKLYIGDKIEIKIPETVPGHHFKFQLIWEEKSSDGGVFGSGLLSKTKITKHPKEYTVVIPLELKKNDFNFYVQLCVDGKIISIQDSKAILVVKKEQTLCDLISGVESRRIFQSVGKKLCFTDDEANRNSDLTHSIYEAKVNEEITKLKEQRPGRKVYENTEFKRQILPLKGPANEPIDLKKFDVKLTISVPK